jgi:hypothetical protein
VRGWRALREKFATRSFAPARRAAASLAAPPGRTSMLHPVIRWIERLGAPRIAIVAVEACIILIVVAFLRALTAGDSFRAASLAAAWVLIGMAFLGLLYAWRLGASGPPP